VREKMNISYYAKKRITNTIINIFMLLFLVLTLLPIGWMIYSSLKDSTDIAIGKVGLRRASNNVLEIMPQGKDLLVLTADGGINLCDKNTLKTLKHKAFRTAASSYDVDDKNIWIASADKGLIRVNRQNFNQSQAFSLPIKNVDWNKVTNTYIKKQGNNIFVSFDYKRLTEVLVFDAEKQVFVKTVKVKKSNIFPDAGVYSTESLPGVDGEVFCQYDEPGYKYIGGSAGKIYKLDIKSNKFVVMAKLSRGHLLIRFNNYVDMWKNVNFGLYLRNSIIICGITMVIAMIFATFAAYSLSRFRFPGSDMFSNAILATQMIPMIMYLIPIYIMFVKFTMLTNIPVKGTFPGIILIYSAWFLPFSIWILRGFFAAIPKELEEAALIDGCSRLRVFWHVALPLARPGIIATGIYVFLNAWDELMFAWVLTNADTMTIPVGIRLFVGNYQNRFDLMMAAATVATIPVVVLFFLLQKHIVRGLTAGAVKG